MNNANIIKDTLDSSKPDISFVLRERETVVTEIIDALQNVGGSSFWKILQQNIFEVDLNKAKRRLANEKDTTEMFRLQGEIRAGEKLNLENLIIKYRKELITIRQKLL